MAYDQNALPNSLRPINIARTLAEDSRIVAPVTLAAPIPQVAGAAAGPGGAIPVYYPSTVPAAAVPPEPAYVGLSYGNVVPAVANWLPRVPPPVTAGVGLPPGFVYNNTSFAAPLGYDPAASSVGTGSNASDHASDEGGDDSVSGRKVKFLCSFGGKILPRPSDGVLRYVGGDTRIISVRRDVGFNDLVQKMFDSYGRDVVIKYQLPDEDLDALVTVSRPDDLENMMDEYDKLVERSSDGSAKLRVFLFSENESSSVIRFKDLQDSGQKYVEAVNGIGIGDSFSAGGGSSGAGGGGGIGRKASATSTQNSELSGTEGSDAVEVIGGISATLLSPSGSSATGKSVTVPASLAQSDHEVEIMEQPVPVHLQQTRQLGYDMQPGTAMAQPGPYVQTYIDPRHATFSHTEYVQVPPPQMSFPTQIMYSQPQFHDNMVPQFIPQSSHVSFKPNPAPAPSTVPVPVPVPVPVSQLVQQQEERVYGQQVVKFSGDQSYTGAAGTTTYQPQAQVPVITGPYGWSQVPPPDQVTQQLIYPEPLPRFDGCTMCQKALPHAHSDPIAHERKESPRSTVSDMNPVYQSLRLEDTRRMGVQTRFAGQNEYSGQVQYAVSQRPETRDHGMVMSPPGVVGLAGEMQSPPFGVAVQQTGAPVQYHAKRVSGDSNPSLSPTSDSQLHESSPRDYPGNFPLIVTKDDNVETGFTYDNLRQMEELRIRNDQSGFRVENPREEILENRPELNLDASLIKQNEILPYSFESLYNSPSNEGGSSYSGTDSARGTGADPPVSEWKVYPSQFEPEPVLMDTLNPFNGLGEGQDGSNSLFSNQDPWMFRPDSHFPPPRPNKILTKKEGGDNGESPTGNTATMVDDGGNSCRSTGNLDLNFGAEQAYSNIGSAEELIRQELQAVAEGVAASVLHSSTSNPDSNRPGRSEHASETNHSGEIQYSNVDVQSRNEVEDLKMKLPEKANIGFPVSDGLGRLQIIKNSDLEELRELGSGTFGTVYHGKWRGSDVAIKRINDRCFAGKASEQERMREDFWNEAIKLADLHHPNVVAFYGVVLDGPGGSVATVTEYMVNGSLRTALQKNERNLDKRKRLLIAMDVAFGMEYLHGKNIVHFDLKSDNLLVNLRDPHRPICKVGDLGLSKVKRQTLISGGVRGTLPWMAPELLNGSSSLVSEKVDVFSFGIVMWELLTGDEPYADLHYGAIIGGIVSNTLRPPVPESCNPDWRSLMERCWSAEPPERPSFTEIANQLRTITSKVPPKVQGY